MIKSCCILIVLIFSSQLLYARTAVVYDPISNIRKTPNGKILCKIKKIQKINVSSNSINGWYDTDSCGEKGVIHHTQIVFISGDSIGIVYDPVSNIRLRPNGKIICKVKKISAMKVSKYDNKWYGTNFCGKNGVIHQSQIKLVSSTPLLEYSENNKITKIKTNPITKTAKSNSNYKYYSRSSSCKDRTTVCLALTWGPDVCSTAFSKYAEKNLDFSVHDFALSPTCLVGISKYLDEDFSDTDIGLAILTGVLDESGAKGVESEDLFSKFLGGISYLASHSIKLSLYNSCIRKCN